MAASMDPELVDVIRSICRSEVQGELQSMRADINRLKKKISDGRSDEFLGGGGGRECGLPWECFEQRQVAKSPRARAASSHQREDSTHSLVGGDFELVTVRITDPDTDVESANHEFRQIVRHARHEFDLAFDVWSATTFVIVKDFPDVFGGDMGLENLLRIGMVLFCLALNLFLQFMFLYWVAATVMLPNIKGIQDTYKTFHRVAFNNSGNFDNRGFQSLGEDSHDRICGMAMSSALFMNACLFLWVARCSNELRSIWRRKNAFDRLPQLPSGVSPEHMVHELSMQVGDFLKESKNMIVCLNTTTRLMLDLLIVLPRMLVAFFLLFIGTAFLTSSQSFDDLILNSLAMAFIFDIDELIFKVFLPLRIKTNLEKTKVITPPDEDLMHLTGKALDDAEIKTAYCKSIAYFWGVIAFLVIWSLVQPVLPGFEHDIAQHCSSYLSSIRDVPCRLFEGNCFPK